MKTVSTILIILLFSLTAHSQQKDDSYTALWKEVQKQEKDALTKSALKVVRSISEKARKEKNSPQIVKALLYTSKYALILEEDAQLKISNDFKKAIRENEFPATNILESYLANLYWQYFQENRFRFYNRTKTEAKVDSTDFRTWDLTTLFQEIRLHFENSLRQSKTLQKIKVSEFDALLDQQEDSEIYRPTLFDLLTHAALDFYAADENSITRPADKFEIADPDLLCEAIFYTKIALPTDDETSLQTKALEIYQELIRFHLSDASPEALVDADLDRLRYIYANAVFENKDPLYEEVLKNAAGGHGSHEVSALYLYEIAQLYGQLAERHQPETNEEYQWKRKEALELCETIIESNPESIGAQKSEALKAAILTKDLQLTVEQHIPANKPSKLLVNYRNQNGLQLTAYFIAQNQLKRLRDIYPIEKQLPFIKNLKIAKQWETDLKNEKDYQTHSTEVFLPSLENGSYLILAQPKNTESFAFGHTQVTNLALSESRTPEQHIFQLVDRNDGSPLSNANIKFTYRENYDRSPVNASFITDSMGMVTIPLPADSWTGIDVEVTHKNEKANFGEYYIRQRPNSGARHDVNYSAFLFTDRSIYRPGQPLYFKGITIKKDNDTSAIQTGLAVRVVLNDANGQKVGEQELTTNDFGSFKGEFIVPDNGITGNFSLQVSSMGINLSGYTDISVEEYKRPKFKPSFEPITETYSVNDSITVKGTAKAYAGSTLTDAKVIYRVQRVVYYPPWYYWSRPYYTGSPQEIAHGETKTNASGEYEIVFKSLPDNAAPKEGLPIFNYEITADVTDINGETRSATTTVRVGYHTMTAIVTLPEQINKNKDDYTLSITTANLNGEFVPAKGTLKMYKLKSPEHVLRERPWPAPDYKSFTREKFRELFPYEAFGKEHLTSNWERGELVWESDFNTAEATEISLGNIKKWPSGAYVLELETTDKLGQTVKDIVQTSIYSEGDKQLADNQLFDIRADKSSYTINDEVILSLSSNMEHLVVTLLIEKDRKIVATKLVLLGKNSKTIHIPVNKEDLGGFGINYSFSAYNSFYTGSLNILVPYPDTQLDIETVTFRDKLKPGTGETWSFRVKGARGDKVAAEMLAGMYDASLDAFKEHSWSFNPLNKRNYYSFSTISAHQSYGTEQFMAYIYNYNPHDFPQQFYDTFNSFGLYFGYGYGYRNKNAGMPLRGAPSGVAKDATTDGMELEESVVENEVAFAPSSDAEAKADKDQVQKPPEENSDNDVQIRKNLQETAFFFPQLRTDEQGRISFSFTTPEALTKWKLQLLAHSKTLESSTKTMEAVTQKELMVVPNAPRFLREGDEITFSAKIANLTEKARSGEVKLELADALTGKEVTKQLLIGMSRNNKGGDSSGDVQSFMVDSLGNTQVSWRLKIPTAFQAIQYRIIAKAGDYGDGEQNVLPVLTNRMLVTETMPMWVRGNQTKNFTLEKLKDNTSTTLKHHKLSLEITSNPAWYAVQALPYLMEYPYDCNEQTFARYYANTLASHVAGTNPRIRQVFDLWANSDALLSNLEKNEELKAVVIQETPWARDAISESEQKKRIALLFNLNKMKAEQDNSLNKLKNNQMSSGAWAWFKGGRANRYITQHIITGLGHLGKLGTTQLNGDIEQMLNGAISYLDGEFVKEYNELKKYAKNLDDDHLSNTQIHYLYMRSFFPEIPLKSQIKEIGTYYMGQARKYWMNQNLYSRGLLALSMQRAGDTATAGKILTSLSENSITSQELGMYWKENTRSWYWYQAPVETQALMIEAFTEIGNDTKIVDNLKIWLLKNKQTSQWKSTKATTEAVYALLLEGSDWLAVDETVQLRIGGEDIAPAKLEDVKIEAGTGYFKTSWEANEVKPKMAEVEMSKKGDGIAWGALYWQYFEDLDKITPAETPLKLEKKLFLRKNTDTGEEMSEITPKTNLEVGALIRVRIELRADRPMEFVHMKDMRASGLEPVNVLSQYKWQDGLGYYESTKDASINFFFDHVPKGVFVFEYDLRVNNAGDFSNGITTVQSMYAPEFSSHSEGVRVTVESGQ